MTRAILIAICICRFATPLAAQETAFRWNDHPTVRAGKWLRLDFRARLQADRTWSEVNAGKAGNSGLDIARRRVGVEGRIMRAVDFELEYEIAAREWRDALVDYRQFTAVRVRAGRFKMPFSLDEMTSATKLDFVYRSRIAARLAPGRDNGVLVHGQVLRNALAYEAGLFRNDGDNARPGASARVFGGRSSALRLVARPLVASRSTMADWQVGIALSETNIPEGFSAVRARTVLGSSFYDSDVWVKGRRRRVGLETRWRPGPAAIQAEYIRLTDERRGQSVEDGDLSPLQAAGWYISGTWLITGERKSKGGDRPARPLALFSKQHGIGAVELAARIERLDFGNGASGGSSSPRADRVLGNANQVLTYGINWYLNRWVKLQANLVRERLSDPLQGPLPLRPVMWTRLFRLQFAI
jgi:phosphate-selective porin OprO and OprP